MKRKETTWVFWFRSFATATAGEIFFKTFWYNCIQSMRTRRWWICHISKQSLQEKTKYNQFNEFLISIFTWIWCHFPTERGYLRHWSTWVKYRCSLNKWTDIIYRRTNKNYITPCYIKTCVHRGILIISSLQNIALQLHSFITSSSILLDSGTPIDGVKDFQKYFHLATSILKWFLCFIHVIHYIYWEMIWKDKKIKLSKNSTFDYHYRRFE